MLAKSCGIEVAKIPIQCGATSSCGANNLDHDAGFICVAAYVYALRKLHLTGSFIFHVKVDIKNKIAHFLDRAPRSPLCSEPGHSRPQPALDWLD